MMRFKREGQTFPETLLSWHLSIYSRVEWLDPVVILSDVLETPHPLPQQLPTLSQLRGL